MSTICYPVPKNVPFKCDSCGKTGHYKTKVVHSDIDYTKCFCGGTLMFQPPADEVLVDYSGTYTT